MMNLAASRMSFMAVFLGYPRSHSPLCSFTSRRNLLQAYVPEFTLLFKQALNGLGHKPV